MRGVNTYALSWNLDSDFLDGFCEFIRLDSAIVVQVEVLESLLEDGLFGLCALGLLLEFVLKFSLETIQSVSDMRTRFLVLTLL